MPRKKKIIWTRLDKVKSMREDFYAGVRKKKDPKNPSKIIPDLYKGNNLEKFTRTYIRTINGQPREIERTIKRWVTHKKDKAREKREKALAVKKAKEQRKLQEQQQEEAIIPPESFPCPMEEEETDHPGTANNSLQIREAHSDAFFDNNSSSSSSSNNGLDYFVDEEPPEIAEVEMDMQVEKPFDETVVMPTVQDQRFFVFLIDITHDSYMAGTLGRFHLDLLKEFKNVPLFFNIKAGFISCDSKIYLHDFHAPPGQPEFLINPTPLEISQWSLPRFFRSGVEDASLYLKLLANHVMRNKDNKSETGMALGAGIKAALLLFKQINQRGRIVVFQSAKRLITVPPSTTDFRKLGLECAAAGLSINIFLFNDAVDNESSIRQLNVPNFFEIKSFRNFTAYHAADDYFQNLVGEHLSIPLPPPRMITTVPPDNTPPIEKEEKEEKEDEGEINEEMQEKNNSDDDAITPSSDSPDAFQICPDLSQVKEVPPTTQERKRNLAYLGGRFLKPIVSSSKEMISSSPPSSPPEDQSVVVCGQYDGKEHDDDYDDLPRNDPTFLEDNLEVDCETDKFASVSPAPHSTRDSSLSPIMSSSSQEEEEEEKEKEEISNDVPPKSPPHTSPPKRMDRNLDSWIKSMEDVEALEHERLRQEACRNDEDDEYKEQYGMFDKNDPPFKFTDYILKRRRFANFKGDGDKNLEKRFDYFQTKFRNIKDPPCRHEVNGWIPYQLVTQIQTVYPTLRMMTDENFEDFIRFLHYEGCHYAGLVKIVPPRGFMDSGPEPFLKLYGDKNFKFYTYKQTPTEFSNPIITQLQFDKVGDRDTTLDSIYRDAHVKWQEMFYYTIEEFRHEHMGIVSRMQLEYAKDLYTGANKKRITGFFPGQPNSKWAMDSLNTCWVRYGNWNRNKRSMDGAGLTKPYLYAASLYSTFCWHAEDLDVYSLNFMHFGDPKCWMGIPPRYGIKAMHAQMELYWDHLFKEKIREEDRCDYFVTHKPFFAPESSLKLFNVQVNHVTQTAGTYIITFPFGLHAGFSTGISLAEAVNFTIDSQEWIDCAIFKMKCPRRGKCSGWGCNTDKGPDSFIKEICGQKVYDDWRDPSVGVKGCHPFEFHVGAERKAYKGQENIIRPYQYEDLKREDEVLSRLNRHIYKEKSEAVPWTKQDLEAAILNTGGRVFYDY